MAGSAQATEERVLRLARELATEVGGPRAGLLATPTASLERQLGLGSLERVELIARLERVFGRTLDERFLRLDRAAETAAALAAGEPAGSGRPSPSAESAPGAARPLERPPATLHEALWRRAEADPARPHCYLREDDGREHTVSYGDLLQEARAVAGGLRECGVARADT